MVSELILNIFWGFFLREYLKFLFMRVRQKRPDFHEIKAIFGSVPDS